MTQYIIRNIRTLLAEGFTDTELRRLCSENTEFRPVLENLSRDSSQSAIIDQLIDYAERRMRLNHLLYLLETLNPDRFDLHGPYIENVELPRKSRSGGTPLLFLGAIGGAIGLVICVLVGIWIASQLRTAVPTPSTQLNTPPNSTEVITKPSAEQAIRDYYSLVEQGKLDLTWQLLSENYKNTNRKATPDWDSTYFDNMSKVAKVNIYHIEVLQTEPEYVRLSLNMSFDTKTGTNIQYPSRHMDLVWDSNNSRWLIDYAD